MSLQHYNKIKVVGKGSYGEVWLVKHKKDKKQYVLKKLELRNASKRERKAAEQEAKLLSKLKHPNIVSYKDSFQDETGFLFIAMGYCEGGDLYGRLKEQKSKPLEERQVVEWFVQIAMALQYMHERNILHRDLKTQNIFLTKSKIIKLGDLGIARVLDSSYDMATTLIGTPYYMSPELFSNKPYNHKSDVWALGCCVYEMATLKHAFNAKDMNSLVYKILRGKMPQMPKIYSPALVQLIKAMLNQNPERRPSVNRILRDPYIKKNIAIFLEGTKKSRPSSSSSAGRRSTDSARSGYDMPDSSRSTATSGGSSGSSGTANKAYKSRSAAAVPVVELEPLQVGPDLEVIVEEDPDSVKSPTENKKYNRSRNSSGGGNSSNRRQEESQPQRLKPTSVGVYRDKSPGSRSNSRSPGRGDRSDNLPPKPLIKGHRRTGSDPVFGSPSRAGESPKASRRQRAGSDKTRGLRDGESGASPAGSDEYPGNSQDSARSSNDPTSARSRMLYKKKKKRISDPTAEPEPIVLSVDSVLEDNNNKHYHKSASSQDIKKEFGIAVDGQNKPVLKKVSSEPVFSEGGRPRRDSNDGERYRKEAAEKQRRSSDQGSHPSPYTSESDPRPSTSSGSSSSRRGQDRDSAYSSSASRDDAETPRPTTARARRREKLEQETPRTSRSVDLDKKRKSDLPSKKPAVVAYSEDYSRYSNYRRGEEREERAMPKSKSSSSVSASVSSSSDDDFKEEKVQEKENKRNEKEMNNFISLLDTTLKMAYDEDKDGEVTRAMINGATYVKGPAPRVYSEPTARTTQVPEPGEVPVIEVEDTLTEDNVDQMPSHQPEYSYARGTGALDVPAGRTMTTTGRLWERITILRKDCIRGLGVEKLKKAYDILDNIENNEVEPLLIKLLGSEQFEEFAGKIWQLKFCEEAAFGLV